MNLIHSEHRYATIKYQINDIIYFYLVNLVNLDFGSLILMTKHSTQPLSCQMIV